MSDKILPCIWYDLGQARAAAEFYVSLGLPDSRIDRVVRSPADNPSSPAGAELVVEFTLAGRRYIGLNGGPQFPQSESVSFMILTDDQAETDRLWDAIVGDGGQESMCGWCKDRWGVSWQITPRRLMAFYDDPNPARTRAAFEAMMGMRRIDIAALEAAADANAVG
jgi:predicted 3-demethylubiquinone-9 3-methyltransferase (glyoxalase superfamily)